METTELKCDKHNTPTQLRCAQCEKPACTKCLVWTEVGQKCRTCVPSKGGSDRTSIVVPALVVAVLVVILLAVLGVFSPADKPDKVPEGGNRGPTQPSLGQAAVDGALTFVVTRFDCGAEEVGDAARKKTALGRYCLIEFKVKNTGRQPTSFAASMQFLLDRQRRRFAPDTLATTIYQQTAAPGSAISTVQQMNPGAEVESSLIYDIPDSVAPQLAELHAGSTLGVTVRLTESAGRAQG